VFILKGRVAKTDVEELTVRGRLKTAGATPTTRFLEEDPKPLDESVPTAIPAVQSPSVGIDRGLDTFFPSSSPVISLPVHLTSSSLDAIVQTPRYLLSL
jgi:hypothetical protein